MAVNDPFTCLCRNKIRVSRTRRYSFTVVVDFLKIVGFRNSRNVLFRRAFYERLAAPVSYFKWTFSQRIPLTVPFQLERRRDEIVRAIGRYFTYIIIAGHGARRPISRYRFGRNCRRIYRRVIISCVFIIKYYYLYDMNETNRTTITT